MADNFSYQLVGGQPVKITALEANASGAIYAPPGQAFNPVTVSVSPYLEALDDPFGAQDGVYILTATDENEDTVCGVCRIEDNAISETYGDGSFEIDETGSEPTLAWTPSVTAVSVVCWYAASVAD